MVASNRGGSILQSPMNSMLEWLRKKSGAQYSVGRLKQLYAELLVATDLAGTENLGRRRLDEPLLLQPPSSPRRVAHERQDSSGRDNLSTAFKMLAATPAADILGRGSEGLRDDSTVACMTHAQRLEVHLVRIIRSIGDVVAFGDHPGTSLRSDEIFAYFCEKSILSLLVEIAKAKPTNDSKLHASTWSPMVKAEVFRTVTRLVSNAQDGPSLYYLLSNNTINELITCMLPLRQWTDPALSNMIPVYVALLKCLALQLQASPADIFTFLKTEDTFPLFSSTVEIAVSPKTDRPAQLSCLKLIVSMMKIKSDPQVQNWISNSEIDLQRISKFISIRLLDRYHHMAKLVSGLVVDHMRCNVMQGQLVDVQKQIEFMNELQRAGVKAFNVTFCEIFLRSVVSILLENLVPKKDRQFLAVGVSDVDVIPEPEGLAQLSVVFFTHFWSISYPPLTRMLAVALLHPKSTQLWKMAKYKAIKEDYALTRELNAIVQSTKDGRDGGYMDNPYRAEVLRLMTGVMGEWRFIPASMLVEGAMSCPALGPQVLVSFGVLPDFADGATRDDEYPASPLEEALATFLLQQQVTKSAAAVMALERVAPTALSIFSQIIAWGGTQVASVLPNSPLYQAFCTAHGTFCSNALQQAHNKPGLSDLFVDLTQSAIRLRYPKILQSRDPITKFQYGCVLEHSGYRALQLSPEILVRKFRTVGSNDVEDCRFAIQMALEFRSTCKVLIEIRQQQQQPHIPKTDWADELLLRVADLADKPVIGTDLDLRGRMAFNFHSSWSGIKKLMTPQKTETATNGNAVPDRHRSFSDDIVIRSSSQLVLVLDPTDIFVVKPSPGRDANRRRGTIVCSVSLRNLIACASDNEWLHIAARNTEDVGFLIKNGNMALHFDTVGTALIVKQYLERSQSMLRNELKEQIESLFEERFADVSDEKDSEEHEEYVEEQLNQEKTISNTDANGTA